jgi:hypothetical protein
MKLEKNKQNFTKFYVGLAKFETNKILIELATDF